MERIIFHIDVNSAFLSWSALKLLSTDPSVDLRTIPAIIGGDMEKRHGVVLAKSMSAKAYGIKTGEPIVNALRKCPNLTMVPPDHQLYSRQSHLLMDHLRDICPDIEQVSIDECYMDFTPIMNRYDSPVTAATAIKDSVYEQFGFTVNIGISDRKILAKMASDFKKPNLVHTLFHDEIQKKMWPLPVSELFMCGNSSVETLKKLEIITIGDLAKADPQILTAHLKSHGKILWEYANGSDDSEVVCELGQPKGIGNSTTLSRDAVTKEEAYHVLLQLADSVAKRLRALGQCAFMVSTEIKYSTFQSVSHQMTLTSPTNTSKVIYETACQLFDALWNQTPIRLLGIRTSRLQDASEPVQLNIFDIQSLAPANEKQQQLDNALDSIRHKFGEDSIIRGSSLMFMGKDDLDT